MEPIRNTKTARLRRLKMYREDLDEFIKFFQDACSNVTIADGENRYDSLDEMKAHVGSQIKNLDIRGEKPGLHFLLNQKEPAQGSSTPVIFNELRTEEITDEADALFFKVREFLTAHQRPLVRLPFAIIAIIALAATILLAVRETSHQQVLWKTLGATLILAGATVAALKIDNYLMLETKLNSPSFWTRHREAFAAHAVTAAISSILGGTVGWFACHFLK